MTDWVVTGALGIISLFITIAALLKRTFVFKEECRNMRQACADMQEKTEALHTKDLEMRDQMIEMLERKFEQFRKDIKTEMAATRDELREEMSGVKGILQTILAKVDGKGTS